ncbi:MAG: beta-galactosidase [Kiritimatiellae bacterium]|nr:beta-galactosidase [Kiritimatiellia bacterium]
MNTSDNKVLAVAGYWEPLAHYRRGGWWVADDENAHTFNHSEPVVEQLKELAVNAVVWPGYKGLGLQYERAEWENLKPFRKLVERAGIEMGAYLQCGSYWAESLYRENPKAREWTAIDYWGKPQSYSEYGRCYWRHRPCLTHREFSDYVANIASILVKEYGITYFYADNNAQMPCYTPRFEKAFRDFLKEKYATHTPEGLKRFTRRYGHAFVDDVMLPTGSARRPIDAMPGLTDPGIQDWCEFRCRLVADNARVISAAAKAANPATRLCYNIAYDQGEFHQLVWGTEPELFADVADQIFSEDANSPRVEPDGRLISHAHTCKHLRAMGRPGVFHAPSAHGDMSNDSAILSLMELAVHNQGSLGPIYEFGAFEVREGDARPSTIRFIRKHEDIFTNNDEVSEIAVLRSRHSNTINWLQSFQGMLLAQQSLLQAGYQWDNVIESNLDTLDKYRLLVLPETISETPVPEALPVGNRPFQRADGGLQLPRPAAEREGLPRLRSAGIRR